MNITAVMGQPKMGVLEATQYITRMAIKNEELRDELYCHIMKQYTNNPSKVSRARATILLTMVLGCFIPSGKLLPPLRKFIADGPPGYAAYCALLLRRTIHNGARDEPQCKLELEAAKRKQVMRVSVGVDLVTGSKHMCRLDPASCNEEWVNEICASMGVKDSYGWSIYLERNGKLISLRGAGGKGITLY